MGFKDLAEDLLKIASMMKDKKADGMYDLDRLLNIEKQNIINNGIKK